MNTINHFTDLYSAEKHAYKYDAVISLGWKLDPKYLKHNAKYLFLDFDDFDLTAVSIDPSNAETAPNESHIRRLMEFIKELNQIDLLLIHCFAGYSRSSAGVLIAKCIRDKKDLPTARSELYDARIPDKLVPCPNSLMIHQYLMIS